MIFDTSEAARKRAAAGTGMFPRAVDPATIDLSPKPLGTEPPEELYAKLMRQKYPAPAENDSGAEVDTTFMGPMEYMETCFGKHYGAVITPQMIWHLLLCQLAEHVVDNPERYRSAFTVSDTKVNIALLASPSTVNAEMYAEALRSFIPGGDAMVDLFFPDFSDNDAQPLYREAAATAFCEMSSPFYSYEMLMCGIPKVRVDGTLEDWKKILTAFNRIASTVLPLEDALLGRVGNVLSQLVSCVDGTYSPEQAVAFMGDMFWIEHCGSGHQEVVEGWFKDLYFKVPRNTRYVSNFLSCTSKMVVKDLSPADERKTEYTLFAGIMGGRVDADSFLVPEFRRVVLCTSVEWRIAMDRRPRNTQRWPDARYPRREPGTWAREL